MANGKKDTKRYATMKAEMSPCLPWHAGLAAISLERRRKSRQRGSSNTSGTGRKRRKRWLRTSRRCFSGRASRSALAWISSRGRNRKTSGKRRSRTTNGQAEGLTPGQLLFRDIRGKYEAASSEETLKAAMDYEDFNAEELAKIPEKGRAGIKAAREAATQRITAKGKEAGNE